MKKILFIIFLLSSVNSIAQITISDVLRIGRKFSNPYNVNARSFIEAKDELQLMGYPMMKFTPSSSTDLKTYAFYYQKSGTDREKLVITSQHFTGDIKKKVYGITVNTNDIEQYNAMLTNAMNHSDFFKVEPNLYLATFISKPSTGVKESLIFSPSYVASTNGEMNIQIPIIYTVFYIREELGL